MGNARPSSALTIRVTEASASMPRYALTRGHRRTSLPGAGTRREALAVVVPACRSGELTLGMIEDEHPDWIALMAKRQGPVYSHGHKQKGQVEQTVSVHLPGDWCDRTFPQQANTVPEQSATEQERRYAVEGAKSPEEGRHQGEREQDQGIGQHLELGASLAVHHRQHRHTRPGVLPLLDQREGPEVRRRPVEDDRK